MLPLHVSQFISDNSGSVQCTLVLVPVPEHNFFHAIVVHVLHSLVGRNQSPSKFCVHSQTFCSVELYKVDTLPVSHHTRPTITIAEVVYEMYFGVFFVCKIVGILTETTLQHNTVTLAQAV